MTFSECCGRRPREINIDITTGRVTVTFCATCETRRWYRDGRTVELAEATEAFSSRWNRKRAVAESTDVFARRRARAHAA